MRLGYRKIFLRDPKLLSEMFQLRREGRTITWLAIRYGCDHTTISYHLRKCGVHVGDGFEKPLTRPEEGRRMVADRVRREYKYGDLLADDCVFINLGKESYEDYVAAEAARRSISPNKRPRVIY